MGLLALFAGLALLLALNAFFVLAEFAIVKVRPSRVEQLATEGDPRAGLVAGIQSKLDEYLSVCQVGITLASVALGMAGEKTSEIIMGGPAGGLTRYIIAISVSYLLIAGAHILLGELVPKSIAIRISDSAALWCAKPLRAFHVLFFPALWLLTHMSNAILNLTRIGRTSGEAPHSEGELRIILNRSQEEGTISFRRLLFIENIFDMGSLTVRNTMRQRSQVRFLDTRAPWDANLQTVRTSHFSRYPLISGDDQRPVGFIHVKDLALLDRSNMPDLKSITRPLLTTTETTPIETLFAEMQRRRIHIAIVNDSRNQWTGLVTLEDIIEELVGTIRDEFEDEELTRLADTLTIDRVHLDIEADTPVLAVQAAFKRMPAGGLPLPPNQLLHAIAERERMVGTYLGNGIGMPHARIDNLAKPLVMFLRSTKGVPCDRTAERAHLLFVLLTPASQPRIHQRLQSIIAMLLHESDFVKERLMTAETREEIIEVLRTGEQAALG